jgi:hypothetical protein
MMALLPFGSIHKALSKPDEEIACNCSETWFSPAVYVF